MSQGGNAVDAALAAAIALTVVEPVMNGIGGDLYAMVWHKGKLHSLNATGRSPAAWTPERFSGLEAMPKFGWQSVTVPGQVEGWKVLSDRFGKLPFQKLFEPAIRYATGGFPVSPLVAAHWPFVAGWVKDQPGFGDAFLRQGRAPAPGERWSFPDQARTLQLIAETKGEAFYTGAIAEAIVAWSNKTGGDLCMEDLASNTADWVEPISRNYRGVDVHEIPPNGQGIAALMALGIAEQFDLAALGVDSPLYYHVLIESMKAAFADLHAFVGDSSAMTVSVSDLLSNSYLSERSRLIDMKRASDMHPGRPGMGGTVYLATGDQEGTMVSFIQSNYLGFGSGIVVPGTGIALHNRGSSFSLRSGHPNQVGPRKRPLHSIIPAFMTKDDKPLMAFGVMGGNMQAQGHLQIVSRMIDHQQNPQAASDAPRFLVNHDDNTLMLEAHAGEEVSKELLNMGHAVDVKPTGFIRFGSGQFVYKLESGYLGASDSRRDGQAVGF